MKQIVFYIVILIFVFQGCCDNPEQVKQQVNMNKITAITWQEEFNGILPLLGHRNWVLIVDKAFPLQSSVGMKYIDTREDILDVAGKVLTEIENAPHVNAVVYTDKELKYVTEELSPGIDAYKSGLYKLLDRYNAQTLDHEAIFAKLDTASKLFNVVVLKTDMFLPYTSIFIELDCGYWNHEKEMKLRKLM